VIKVRLKDIKFEFCQFKSKYKPVLTGKVLLEFDFSSSLLLLYGPVYLKDAKLF